MMSLLCGEIEGVDPNNPFADLPFEELLLNIKHQFGPFKTPKKKKRVIRCEVCNKKCNRRFSHNHSYSRVSSGTTYYACSKKHLEQLEGSLTTEDDYVFRHEWSDF